MIELARQITFTASRDHPATRISRFLAEFKQIEVTIIGGRIDDSSQSCIGEHGRKLLQNTAGRGILSCNSWDLEKGITAPTEEKAALKRDLIAHASRKILRLTAQNTVHGRCLISRILMNRQRLLRIVSLMGRRVERLRP